jgi:TPR repeat protein
MSKGFSMGAGQVWRIAGSMALASLLAACGATNKLQSDITRGGQSVDTTALNKDDGERSTVNRTASRQPPASSARSDLSTQSPERGPAEPGMENAALADLQKRAEAGDAEAAFMLGLKYDSGDGVARDPSSALRWYLHAAEHGHILGALNVAVLYDSGIGWQRDAASAALWYRKAADQGNGRAAYNLAQLYEAGEGVARDAELAARWYDMARRASIAAADGKLAVLMPRAPVVPLRRETLAPLKPPGAAEPTASKVPDSLRLALAKDYAVGNSAPDDPLVADAIRAAAQAGNREAACNIGMRFVNGRGVTRDWAQGETWLRRAALQDHAPAQTNLAMLLASEQNPKADIGEALMWASKAASAGYGPARAQLGMMYAAGLGVPRDRRMADFWLASAARDMREPPGSCKATGSQEALSTR